MILPDSVCQPYLRKVLNPSCRGKTELRVWPNSAQLVSYIIHYLHTNTNTNNLKHILLQNSNISLFIGNLYSILKFLKPVHSFESSICIPSSTYVAIPAMSMHNP